MNKLQKQNISFDADYADIFGCQLEMEMFHISFSVNTLITFHYLLSKCKHFIINNLNASLMPLVPMKQEYKRRRK
jgi:hypothetical protein